VNCSEPPFAKLELAGVTVMPVITGATTFNAEAPVLPLNVAEIVALPGELPVASPVELTDVTEVSLEAQVADAVTSFVDPLL